MSNEFVKKLENTIIRLFDADNNEIKVFDKIEIRCEISKYTFPYKKTLYIYVNGVEYHKNRTMYIEYKCPCGAINKILLKRFLSKKTLKCRSCKEKDVNKRIHHSKVLLGLEEKKKKSVTIYNFDNESNEFKKKYFDKHLTNEEFLKFKKYIYSINNVILENKEIEFIPYAPCPNQKKYRQMILVDGKYITLQNIKLKCPLCGKIFSISRLLKHRIKQNNFDCKDCCFVNKIFRKRKYNDNLTYQSKLELYFIKLCEEKGIEIIDGNKINYFYDEKKRTYAIDFFLPQLRKQVEVKGDHIWHKNQIKTGKWAAKENAAKVYCEKNNMSYDILFKEDFETFFNSLKR